MKRTFINTATFSCRSGIEAASWMEWGSKLLLLSTFGFASGVFFLLFVLAPFEECLTSGGTSRGAT